MSSMGMLAVDPLGPVGCWVGASLERTRPTDTSTGWDLVNLGIQSTPLSFSAVDCCCYEGVYSVWVGGACQVAPP